MIFRFYQRRLSLEAQARADWYAMSPSRAARLELQLSAFNSEWKQITTDVPFYRTLRAEKRLPETFQSWDDVIARVPPTTRALVQKQGRALWSERRAGDFIRSTGGSTAEPVSCPIWRSEVDRTTPNIWLARSWYGIRPASRLFLIWGHRHLLGPGLKGWIDARRRQLSDRALGYCRFSAYDLRPERLREAAREMLRFCPAYVIGYSVALDLFARANAANAAALRALGLKAVIGTAEAFPAPDSQSRLRDLFHAPVGMEYGSVETALVAHMHPDGGYRVFWRDYFVEAEPQGTGRPRLLRITTLYARAFPLIRYELGDEIELDDVGEAPGLERFRRVVGRCNDYLPVEGGSLVHSEAIAHAVSGHEGIEGYQLVRRAGEIRLRLVAGTLSAVTEASIRDRLGRIHPELQNIPFDRVESLGQTTAGKTRAIIIAH